MAQVIAKVERYHHHPQNIVVKFTTRIDSVVRMLELTEKLRTEQETEGPWDEFRNRLFMEKVYASVNVEFFRGISDVICEVTVDIKTEEKDLNLNSEEHAGTILKEVVDYMEFRWIRLQDDYDGRSIKELLVFKGY
jgi:uncharacterized NAD(P)/FAD-binding protein YdhS